MGFNKQDYKFLRQQSHLINSFEKVLTIGNLELDGLDNFNSAEEIFSLLGTKVFRSLDYSKYEHQDTLCCDLNKPVSKELHNTYDIIFDGGTLEHIFNVPEALSNYMKMLKVDGCLFVHTVTNNFSGHGFYQFSPELFYKVFTSFNGFSLCRMTMFRTGPFPRWKEIPVNLLSHGGRIEFSSLFPMHLIVHARKFCHSEMLFENIYQSNYEKLWKTGNTYKKHSKLRVAYNMLRNYLLFHRSL